MATPSGFLSNPLSQLRDMVAASSAFQSWTGAGSTEAALDRVHLLVAPANAERPFALIDFDTWIRERSAIMNGVRFVQSSGSALILRFQADAQDGEDPDATIAFCNAVGAIIEDLEAAAGVHSPESLGLVRIEMVDPPLRVEEEKRPTEGDYFDISFSCNYTRPAGRS